MKKLLFILILCISTTNLFSQVSKLGYPIIKTYTSKDYQGNAQVWDICQDKAGLMYLGNADGVFEFDGTNWKSYIIGNKSVVFKLFVDGKNTVFVGAVNELGYLAVDKYGQKYYKSLTHLLPKDFKNFGEIKGIKSIDNQIVFIVRNAFFYYNFKTIRVVKGEYKNWLSFSDGKNNFVASMKVGILKIEKDTVSQMQGSEMFSNLAALSMIPYKDGNFVVASFFNGIYLYNTDNKTFTPINSDANKLLVSARIFDVKAVKDKYFVFATYNNGVVITDYNFNLLKIINSDVGLANNTCSALFVDKNDNIWALTQNGICLIETSTALSLLDKRSGVSDVVISSYFDNKRLLLGSFAGLTYLDKNDNSFVFNKIDNSKEQVWSIQKINNDILLCGMGIWKLNEKKVEHLGLESTQTLKIATMPNKDLFVVGAIEGCAIFKRENNSIRLKKRIVVKGQAFRWFDVDDEGNLWQTSETQGIFRYKLNTACDSIVKTDLYDTLKGLPTNLKNLLYKINNKLYVCNDKGIYTYNKKNDVFEPEQEYNKLIKNKELWVMDFDNEGNLWFRGDQIMGRIYKDKSNHLQLDSTPFFRFENKKMSKFYIYNADTVLFCFGDGNYLYYPKIEKNYKPLFKPVIKRISVLNSKDTLKTIFGGVYQFDDTISYFQNQKSISQISYSKNSLKIEFAAPLYEGENPTKYSFYLKGYENNFNAWTTETYKEYTNLSEGNYTFLVKARNCWGVETEITTYSFTIQPPWYRTIWAYLLYFIVIIFAIRLIVKFYTHRLIAQKEHLEQVVKERTAEISQQKEEISTTLDLVNQQKEEIQAKNEKLIELDHFKVGMTGMIVHDLKNPLNLILNSNNLERVKQSGKQMLNLVMNILDIQKFEDTKMKLELVNHSAYTIAQSAYNQVEMLIREKNISFENKINPQLGIKTDSEILERVFVNLLTNATKYTPNNGKIVISEEVKVKSEEVKVISEELKVKNEELKKTPVQLLTFNSQLLTLKVSDTGQGIPSDKIHLVFEKFGQIEAKKSGGIRSTGLGLTFCKLAVEAHGGQIGVESELGVGTNFWFTIPLGTEVENNISVETEQPKTETLNFSTEDKQTLLSLLPKFKELEVYEVSSIRNILKNIDITKKPALQFWVEEMLNVIRAGNEEMYAELLNRIEK